MLPLSLLRSMAPGWSATFKFINTYKYRTEMDFTDALKAGGASATLIAIFGIAVKVIQSDWVRYF